MVPIEDILAPHHALESLVKRAGHGNRPALRLLLEHAPRVIEAEGRWLYPALLHRSPGGAHRVHLIPFSADHEQMLELLEHVAASPAGRLDPMFRAMQWLMIRHGRAERRWLEAAIAAHRPRDDPALARFVARCRPLLEDVARLVRHGDPSMRSGSQASAGRA